MSAALPLLVVSTGCPAGIGPDISVAAAAKLKGAATLLLGDLATLRAAAELVGVPQKRLALWDGQARDATKIYLAQVGEPLTARDCTPGKPNARAGQAQLEYIEAGFTLVKSSARAALVTGPVSKAAIAHSGLRRARGFLGHTEWLQALDGAPTSVMCFVSASLATSLVTTHLPLGKVPRAIKPESVTAATVELGKLLQKLGKKRPRLAVASLNPHAGESELLGGEEALAIAPGIASAKKLLGRSALVSGPLGAETAYRKAAAGAFDGVVAMYHDQATIPMKLLAFGDAVNVTAGLSIVRTSVDHGTAYDIAWRGQADPEGMLAALALAARIVTEARMNLALFVSALQQGLVSLMPRAKRLGLSPSEAWNVLVVAQLRQALTEQAIARGRQPALLEKGRLFRAVPGFQADLRGQQRQRLLGELGLPVAAPPLEWRALPVEAFGQLYEALLAARPADADKNLRKRTGSYYTPEALTRIVVDRAFDALLPTLGRAVLAARPLRILDPALGAGAFLVQAGRETARRSGRSLTEVVQHELYGVDVSPLAVAVAEASLWLLADTPSLSLEACGEHLHEADALCTPEAALALGRRGLDFASILPDADSFDLVLGNPPWVAFAGRATQPLAPALREHYRQAFRAFRGYPTLHALFVELSASLAPAGVVALLVPSPLADLNGYRHVRAALAATHAVHEPLLELGQDAFESVTQPCFALVASPRREPEPEPERPFVLTERRHAGSVASQVSTPPALERLARLPRLPPQLFGEMGLQTNSSVTRTLLYRGSAPPPEFSYALLEGRNIVEFELSAPRLFLKPDRARLAELRCRLRDVSEYAKVKLVVRQTAAITIAAAHDGTPFRNSLLAGFELPEFPFALTLGLLNSTLFRALHLASRRDARQGAFPQVKIAHLRALPAPLPGDALGAIAALSLEASRRGLTPELRRALDATVFGMFGVNGAEATEIARFVAELSPRAGLTVPLRDAEPALQA